MIFSRDRPRVPNLDDTTVTPATACQNITLISRNTARRDALHAAHTSKTLTIINNITMEVDLGGKQGNYLSIRLTVVTTAYTIAFRYGR